MKTLSAKMLSLLERLAEMFPKQHYQTRLEQYIISKNPTNAAEVEHWQREFDTQNWGRSLWKLSTQSQTFYEHIKRPNMNTLKKQDIDTGTDQSWPMNEKLALWAIVLIVIYLIIVQ